MANSTRQERKQMESSEKRHLINKYSFINHPVPISNHKGKERVV